MLFQKILFSNEECDFLLNYKNNVIQTCDDGNYPNRTDVNYSQWTVQRNNDLEFVYRKIENFIHEMFGVEIIKFDEEGWIYEYSLNDGYGMHRDNVFNRRFTIGIQLNEEYEGGDLQVEIDNKIINVNKNKGNCYIFESHLLHGVKPVTFGNRYNFLTFMKKNNYKETNINLI